MSFINRPPIGVDLTYADTVLPHSGGILGAHYPANDGMYQLVKAAGTIAAGGFCTIDELGNATAATDTTSGATAKGVGIAPVAVTVNQYFFAWRGLGQFEALVTNAVAADTNLTTTAVAGIAGTGGDTIIGLRSIDLGVTATRVTVYAATIMATNT